VALVLPQRLALIALGAKKLNAALLDLIDTDMNGH